MVFEGSGAFIYYNTNVLNEYKNPEEREADRARYERTLNKYEFLNQPKIIDTYVKVDLYPSGRDFKVNGYYTLKNKY